MTTKYLKNVAGTPTEVVTVSTSAGSGDADKIASLNASGVLDISITNGKVTSAGAGDSGKLVALDGGGKLDVSVMPTGIGADVALIVASEALGAGDLVNVWNNSGTVKVRKADASTTGKEAHGYVIAAVSSGGTATVYFEGTNSGLTGLVGGVLFLSASTAGGVTSTAPSTAGQIAQRVGFATSATAFNFQSEVPIVLA